MEENMPAIASLEDLRAAHKDLLEAKDLAELKAVFKNGAVSDGKISANCGWKSAPLNN
jgi:hypothetical protein